MKKFRLDYSSKANCNESEEWSSQLIFQFKQLERGSLKKSGLQRDSNPWPPRYRCDALPTELWNHTFGARSINWVHIFPWGVKWCEVKWCEGHGFESRWSPDFFRLPLSNCLNWKIICDDHSSLSSTTAVHIWIISYKLHIANCNIALLGKLPYDFFLCFQGPWRPNRS